MPENPRSKLQENIAKVFLTVAFLGIVGMLGWWVETKAGWVKVTQLSVMDLVLLGFATYRLGRMLAFDRIMDPFRAPFTKVVDDNSGDGKTVVPRGTGVQQSLGQLLSCPICAGTWVAVVLVGLLLVAPSGTRIFLYVISAAALAELLHSLTETLCWVARHNRTASGAIIHAKDHSDQSARSDTAHSHENKS